MKKIYFLLLILFFIASCSQNSKIINSDDDFVENIELEKIQNDIFETDLFDKDNSQIKTDFFDKDNFQVEAEEQQDFFQDDSAIEIEDEIETTEQDNSIFEEISSDEFDVETDADTAISGNIYYSNPKTGKMTNPGTKEKPWASLEEIFKSKKELKGGDLIYLESGNHGNIYISTNHNGYITIQADKNALPVIQTAKLENTSHWIFKNLIFFSTGTSSSNGFKTSEYLFSAKETATYLKIENCKFYSAEDSSNWTKYDWYQKSKNGVLIRGAHLVFDKNIIKNTYFALEISGDYAIVTNNLIDNFGADAIRALSSNSKYLNNIIRDAYIEDYSINHDDAIQMYDKKNIASGIIENVEIRNNKIYTFKDTITQKMKDDNLVGFSMQGIIQTDGFGKNIVIENNLIVSDHYHGITLQGAENCRIQNNTVIKTPTSLNPKTDALPWVQCKKDKQGKICKNTILRNNIASKLTPWTYQGNEGMVAEKNLEPKITEYKNYFQDYLNFDFHLKTGSPAIDFGVNKDLPKTDIDGNKRLVGKNVDCGAYEKQ